MPPFPLAYSNLHAIMYLYKAKKSVCFSKLTKISAALCYNVSHIAKPLNLFYDTVGIALDLSTYSCLVLPLGVNATLKITLIKHTLNI